jgi:hypothetical protein
MEGGMMVVSFDLSICDGYAFCDQNLIKKNVACQIFNPGDEIHDFPVEVAVLSFFEDQGLEQ